MKKSLIALTVMVAAGCASSVYAQANVSVYGTIDAGVEHVTNVGPGGIGLTRMPSQTGSVPSRLGFRGTEDLGGGLRAVFTLEQGFFPDTGASGQGGRLFGRQSFVGLSDSWGTVSMGRQYTMLFWSRLDADILGPNIYGIGSLDSYIPNARADNAIAYRGTFGGLTVGATYSFGRDVVNAGPSPAGTNCAGENGADASACREWSAMVKYDAGPWGAALALDTIKGGTAAFAGLTSSAMSDRRVVANGYVMLGQAKVGGGLIRRHNDGSTATPKSDLWFVGAAYPVTPQFTVDGELYRLSFKNSANSARLFAVRGTYNLSRRSAVYATAGNISNSGASALSVSGGAPGSNPLPGASQTGLMVGLRHTF